MTTVTLEERNGMLQLMSDISKEAYGFRVRKDYTGVSDEEVLADWNYYNEVAQERWAEDILQEEHAWNRFKEDLNRVAETCGVSLGTALRWDLEAFDIDMSRGLYDLGYYGYLRGLSYSSEKILEALLGDHCSLL